MGVYDEYGYLGIQIKINETGKRYKIGDHVPLASGLIFGYEGVAVIDSGVLIAVYPYDQMWDKWGSWAGPELKAVVEDANPVKFAVQAAVDDHAKEREAESECTCGSGSYNPCCIAHDEVEGRMEPYWMVHRRGQQSGPATRVHDTYAEAYEEAERLTRQEMDRFVILQAVTLVEPYKPVTITVEAIGDPPAAGVPYPEPLDELRECCAVEGEAEHECCELGPAACTNPGCTCHQLLPKADWCPHCGNDVTVEKPE